MARIGVIAFHPQHAFGQEERDAITSYVKDRLRGEHGFCPIEEIHRPTFVIVCRDRKGYTVYNRWKRSFKLVFDFDVRRPAQRSNKPVALKIKT